jgi:Fe-S-cluster containining protein
VGEADDRSYFFDKGLRFGCTRCGRCCTGKPGVVRITRDEVAAIASKVHLSDTAFIERFTRPLDDGHLSLLEKTDGACVFFDESKGCTVHAARPLQCRLYPFWFRNLRSQEAWTEACNECPGIGKGEFYSREEILMLLRQGIDHGIGCGMRNEHSAARDR